MIVYACQYDAPLLLAPLPSTGHSDTRYSILGHTRGGLGEDPALHQWSLANPEFYSRRGGGGGLFFRLPPDDAALLRGYDPSGGVLPPVPTPPVFPSTCSSLNSVL